MIRGWDFILAGWRRLYETQPISNQPVGLGFHIVRGDIDTGGYRFRRQIGWSRSRLEGFLIWGWGVILPGWRWQYEPQPISNQPVGLGFPHCAGWCRPEGTTVFIPGLIKL